MSGPNGDEPTHPHVRAGLLMLGVVALLVLIAPRSVVAGISRLHGAV